MWLAVAACAERPERAIADAEALTFESRPGEALKRYEDALLMLAKQTGPRNDPLLLKALMGAGNVSYLDLQRPNQALGYFQTTLQLFPRAEEAVEARLTLAEIHGALGDDQSAIAQLLRLCQDFPDHPESDRHQLLLARGYLTQGNYEQAIVEAQLLGQRSPQSPFAVEAMMLRGSALGLLQRPEAAIEIYAALIERWPDAALAHQARYEWGKLLIGLKRDEEAEAILVEALKGHPQPKMIQRLLAGIRERLMNRRAASLNESSRGR
ncbi:MAG: tetratricopeptide repeat protein [Myxococcales bacterium]|jgi:tetratricopeptide (TPR) repeat protein|nr:tetratricopeptide repeat protein [Myxococcales bacterium]